MRWSSTHISAKDDQTSTDNEELIEAYEHSYEPTFKTVINSPSMTRSSRSPIFTHTIFAAKISALNDFFGKIALMEPSSQILIISQSIEGLTFNLQSPGITTIPSRTGFDFEYRMIHLWMIGFNKSSEMLSNKHGVAMAVKGCEKEYRGEDQSVGWW